MHRTWHIPRRTFLRGLGATLALPMLEAMTPPVRLLAQTTGGAAVTHPLRMAFIYIPNGAHMEDWTPAQTGMEFVLPRRSNRWSRCARRSRCERAFTPAGICQRRRAGDTHGQVHLVTAAGAEDSGVDSGTVRWTRLRLQGRTQEPGCRRVNWHDKGRERARVIPATLRIPVSYLVAWGVHANP